MYISRDGAKKRQFYGRGITLAQRETYVTTEKTVEEVNFHMGLMGLFIGAHKRPFSSRKENCLRALFEGIETLLDPSHNLMPDQKVFSLGFLKAKRERELFSRE